MTIKHLFRFLFWFAWRDLFERRARRTTFVVLLTLSALTAFTLVVYGLAMGYERVRLSRLQRDPQALCLTTGDLPLGRKITPELLAELRRKIPEALDHPDGLVGCHAYYETELNWVSGAKRETPLTGRTLAVGDPLLDSHPLQSGTSLRDEGAEGVIVTPSLLRALELPTSPPPSKLQMISQATGEPIDVPIAGVTRDGLPLGHYFVLGEAYQRRLLTEDSQVAVANIRTGAVPASWPEPSALPREVRQALDALEIDPPVPEEVAGRKVWVLRSNAAPPPLRSTWLAYLLNLRELMEKKHAAAPDFARVDAPEAGHKPPVRKGYDLASIYVRDLNDLQPAAHAAQSIGLQVNDDVIRQLEGIARSSRNALLLLTIVVAVVVLLSFGNIYMMQELRTQQKVKEFGLLRAIGMSDRLLRRVYLAEGAVLWCLASAAGVVLGLLAGTLVTAWVIDDPSERSAAFYCSARVIAALLATSGLVCWFSVLLATRSARRASPIETLHLH